MDIEEEKQRLEHGRDHDLGRRRCCHVEVAIDPMCPISLKELKIQLEELLNNTNTNNKDNGKNNAVLMSNNDGKHGGTGQRMSRMILQQSELPIDLQKAILHSRIVFDDDDNDDDDSNAKINDYSNSNVVNNSNNNNDENLKNDNHCCIMKVEEKKQKQQQQQSSSSSTNNIEKYSYYIVHPFIMSDEEPSIEELAPSSSSSNNNNNTEEWIAACDNLSLPHQSLDGLWENLIYDTPVKQTLLNYAQSAMLFSDQKVSSHIVHWNRMLLLHGPPGTGKTSLCRALAHKLAIRMSLRYPRGCTLLEIHSHSLFSKWFSTSGKLVNALFQMVRDMLMEDPSTLICVLIDEVESLASSRATSKSGDPSDAMRAVNSLLTSLDKLRTYPNVLVLATTNLTGSVDEAFVDRVDLKLYIGMPILKARYQILKTCLEELARVGIIEKDTLVDGFLPDYYCDIENGGQPSSSSSSPTTTMSNNNLIINNNNNSCSNQLYSQLLSCATKAEGLSGRSLRRLPLQTHARFLKKKGGAVGITTKDFLLAMEEAILEEQSARNEMILS